MHSNVPSLSFHHCYGCDSRTLLSVDYLTFLLRTLACCHANVNDIFCKSLPLVSNSQLIIMSNAPLSYYHVKMIMYFHIQSLN